jgi:hypothetical protein
LDDGQQLGGENKGDPDSLKRPEEPMLNAADFQSPDWLDLDKNLTPLLKDGVINRFYQVEREAEENGIPEKPKKYPVDYPPDVHGRVVAPKELENKGEGQDEDCGDQVSEPLPGGLLYSHVSHYLSQELNSLKNRRRGRRPKNHSRVDTKADRDTAEGGCPTFFQ